MHSEIKALPSNAYHNSSLNKRQRSFGMASEPKGEALVSGIFNGLCSLKGRTLI